MSIYQVGLINLSVEKKKLWINSTYLKKFKEHSVATALARRVFPVPGGPYNNTPVKASETRDSRLVTAFAASILAYTNN